MRRRSPSTTSPPARRLARVLAVRALATRLLAALALCLTAMGGASAPARSASAHVTPLLRMTRAFAGGEVASSLTPGVRSSEAPALREGRGQGAVGDQAGVLGVPTAAGLFVPAAAFSFELEVITVRARPAHPWARAAAARDPPVLG